jgi:hypothetical protein
MQIRRHAAFTVTMEVCTQVSSERLKTRYGA